MLEKKVYSLLGLARKAGRIGSGEFMTERSVKSFKAYLVIIASDSSDNTKKKFKDSCAFYKIPYYEFGDKDGLGHALGNEMRASVAVNDRGLANGLKKLLEQLND
ncbi:MAG: ribosomal L7Ae/L30e/S12e/Gadd45 family protein [Lachnospiraceae bacterium]|nr:ribosomal L7Ae/L30e/S12e/Gadd45 family protein [Lachnospiraceae bacterium]